MDSSADKKVIKLKGLVIDSKQNFLILKDEVENLKEQLKQSTHK